MCRRLRLFVDNISNNELGMTTLELGVAVVILLSAVIAVFLAIDPGSLLQKARDQRRLADLNLLYKALEEYGLKYEHFPASGTCESSVGSCDTSCPCSPLGKDWSHESELYQGLVGGGFLAGLPVDVVNNQNYFYIYKAKCGREACGDKQCCAYYLGLNLENDKQDFVWVYTP